MRDWISNAGLMAKRRLIRRTVDGGHSDNPANEIPDPVPTTDWVVVGAVQLQCTTPDPAGFIVGEYYEVLRVDGGSPEAQAAMVGLELRCFAVSDQTIIFDTTSDLTGIDLTGLAAELQQL